MKNSEKLIIPKSSDAQKVEEITKEFQDFVYIVSHDFNAPLRHIKQFSELLIAALDDGLGEKEKQYTEFIYSSLDRIDIMQNSLAEYSRVSIRGEPFQTVNAQGLIDEALESLGDVDQGINLAISYDNIPSIHVDPAQLRLVFYHLIGNALKFHEDNSVRDVSIIAKLEPDVVVFEIRDNGIGIQEKFHEEVFKMFRTLHGEDAYEGSGAGLAIVRKIVNRHRGKVWIESEFGKGTSVFFSLPRA